MNEGSDDDLVETVRRVLAANLYLTLGTLDPDGRPRLSPMYFTSADCRRFYWVSSPTAHHSHNLAARSDAELVIFDSTAEIGRGEAVYVSAEAAQVPDDRLEALLPEALSPQTRGGVAFTSDEPTGDADLRFYVATAHRCEVHIPGADPTRGRGIDHREPVPLELLGAR